MSEILHEETHTDRLPIYHPIKFLEEVKDCSLYIRTEKSCLYLTASYRVMLVPRFHEPGSLVSDFKYALNGLNIGPRFNDYDSAVKYQQEIKELLDKGVVLVHSLCGNFTINTLETKLTPKD